MPLFVDEFPPGQCIFCRLVAGEIPSADVLQDHAARLRGDARSYGQSCSTKRSKVSFRRCSHMRLSALLAKLASKLLNASW